MLEDCLVDSRSSARSKKPVTLALSVLTHGGLLGALILVPLFQNQMLPRVEFVPPMPPAPHPIQPYVRLVGAPGAAAPARQAPTFRALVAPEAIPAQIARVVDAPPQPVNGFVGSSIGTPGGLAGGPFVGGLLDQGFRAAGPPLAPPSPPPAAPPAAPETRPQEPVRRVSQLVQANLIQQVKPIYPRLAVSARVHGVVILEAVITKEGRIDPARLRVVEGHPMLSPAAVEAVEKWRYRPLLLNGEPVEVVTTITVNFSLN